MVKALEISHWVLSHEEQKLASEHYEKALKFIGIFNRKYSSYKYEDIYDAGIYALVRAAKTWDESNDKEFEYYLYYATQQSVFRMIEFLNREKRKGNTLSLDQEHNDSEELTLLNLITVNDTYPLIENNLLESIYGCLNDREKKLIYANYIKKVGQQELANEIGVSKARVSAIIKRGLEKMRLYALETGY